MRITVTYGTDFARDAATRVRLTSSAQLASYACKACRCWLDETDCDEVWFSSVHLYVSFENTITLTHALKTLELRYDGDKFYPLSVRTVRRRRQ